MVLLTGATGFIGKHLIQRLNERSIAVRVLVLPGTETMLPPQHRKPVVGSLADRDILIAATRGIDTVYHLAGALPGSSADELQEVNVRGTKNLVEACLMTGVRRFVFTSTAAVYESAPRPFMWSVNEKYPLRASGDDELAFYASSKIEAEIILLDAHRRHRAFHYVIVRPTATYGVGAVWLSQFLGRILDDPRPAYTRIGQFPGMQWIHVNDLTSALVKAGRRSAPLNHIINVAGSELFSVFDLLSIADKALRSRSRFDVFSSWGRVGASNRLKFDISLAEQLLDYAPQITLKQGIEPVVRMMAPGHARC